jgi:methionyl-tRNA synthetase
MPDQPKFYLTTPIYYVNARPHIGHAYTTIVADVLARRHRLLGDDTFFLTGTDEHGQKIERSASAAGIPPQQFADQVSAQFRNLWDRMGLNYSDFIRTTEPRHARGVQQLFRTLYEKGFIYLSQYTGAYCVSDEAFVDLPIGTPCPDCGRPLEQVTEENFFFKLSAFQEKLLQLIESNELLIEPITARNEVLSFIRGDLKKAEYDFHFDAIYDSAGGESPTREKAIASAIREGKVRRSAAGTFFVPGALKDLSISRSSFTWGIPVPDDILAAAGATQKHVVYVWLDALANYMTAVGYGSENDPTLTPEEREEAKAKFKTYWPADLHLVGKEITRFHCVYWPAFLMAAGIDTPKRITANGWLLFDNAKMSKSRGNVVRTETILDAFGTLCPPPSGVEPSGPSALGPGPSPRDLFAADVLRYFLLREIPFGQDGSFSFDAMVTRYNADLANGYGNLVSRTFKMIELYFDGVIPPATEIALQFGAADIIPDALEDALIANLERHEFAAFLEGIARIVAATDTMLTTHKPWKERDNDFATLLNRQFCLHVAAAVVQRLAMLLYPVIPYAAAQVWIQLGLGSIEQAAANGTLSNLDWSDGLSNTKLGPLSPIFPRADKGLADIMIDMENPAPTQPDPRSTTDPAAAPRALDEPAGALPVAGSTAETTRSEPAPTNPTHASAEPSGIFAKPATAALSGPLALDPGPSQITIDDFAKIELRIAEIKLAERIPKADKLLRLEVSLGTRPDGTEETRQILSGIAEHYTPDDLIGRRIIVITNLAPRKMRGLESHGMLLAGSEEGGKPYLATVPEGVPLGTRLK